jgi:hypothetical protein
VGPTGAGRSRVGIVVDVVVAPVTSWWSSSSWAPRSRATIHAIAPNVENEIAGDRVDDAPSAPFKPVMKSPGRDVQIASMVYVPMRPACTPDDVLSAPNCGLAPST